MADHFRVIQLNEAIAGGGLTPSLTNGDARPLWKPHLVVPASRGGVNIECKAKRDRESLHTYLRHKMAGFYPVNWQVY